MKSQVDCGFWIGGLGLQHISACGCAIPVQNRQPKIKNPSRGAFTLIEVLVAIALILALVGTMYAFLHDMLSARRRVIEHVWQETAASALIKQLDVDLQTCIVGDSVHGSGVQGDATRLRILSRGVAAHLAGRGVDDPDVFSDLQLAEYRFNAANQRIEGRRGPAQATGPSAPPLAPLEGQVSRVRFRYHDGRQWQVQFDSRVSNRLPIAVEVAVWYQDHSSASAQNASADHEDSVDDSASDESSPDADDAFLEPAAPEDEASVPPPDRIRIILIPDAGHVAHSTEGETP